MKTIKIDFKYGKYTPSGLYDGRYLEIRFHEHQKRFYEIDTINKKEYCLKKDTVSWLVHKGSLPRTKEMKQLLK